MKTIKKYFILLSLGLLTPISFIHACIKTPEQKRLDDLISIGFISIFAIINFWIIYHLKRKNKPIKKIIIRVVTFSVIFLIIWFVYTLFATNFSCK